MGGRSYAYKLGRQCQCGKAIVDRSKSGLCHPCFVKRLLADPERGKRVSAGLRRYLSDPANKAAHDERAKRGGITKKADPVWREKAARVMREIVQPASMVAGANTRQRDWAAMTKLGLEARWAWCPPEYREAYLFIRSKGVKRDDARKMIRDQIAKDKATEIAKLSPFERQERALARGARLVANDRGPSFGEAIDYGEGKWERLAG